MYQLRFVLGFMLVAAKSLYQIRLAKVSTTLKISRGFDCLDIIFSFILSAASVQFDLLSHALNHNLYLVF